MTSQQDLVDLIGLKTSDTKLINHFDALGLKQPKYCTPNNSSSDSANKADNTHYWFDYEVTHETCYPPKREGKPPKWTTYLKAISLVNESNILKKPDRKPASFWNLSPSPIANLPTITAFFGEPTASNESTIYFCKKLNDLVEINCQFSVKQQRARSIEARIIEESEIISYLYFRDLAIGESDVYGSGSDEQNFMCMLMKWLHDHKHLNVAQNEALAADKSAILRFVNTHFKGKIWLNHLVNQDRLFSNFVSDGMYLVDEKGLPIHLRFQEIGLKALGKWDAYKNFQIESDRLKETNDYPDIPYWEEQENLMKNIPINDANFALFSKGVDDCLVRYHQLMLLPANRKTHNLD